MTISLSLEEVDDLTMHALMACDRSKSNARSVTGFEYLTLYPKELRTILVLAPSKNHAPI